MKTTQEVECGHGNRFRMDQDGDRISYTPLHEITQERCFLGTIRDYQLPAGQRPQQPTA